MSKHNVVCCFCDEPIEPCETAICKGCIDELHKNIRKLQARIAELEAENADWEAEFDRVLAAHKKAVTRLYEWNPNLAQDFVALLTMDLHKPEPPDTVCDAQNPKSAT